MMLVEGNRYASRVKKYYYYNWWIELLDPTLRLHVALGMGNFAPLMATDSDERARESPSEELLSSETQRSRQDKPGEESTRPRPRTTFYTAWVQDWWLLEVVSLLLGTVAIIAICIILIHYQNEPAPEINSIMGVGITLNTIIAILAAVGRASLLLPVAECIGQQKWTWFSGSARPLTELETFDQGSRGAFGSLVLLWRINVR
jgi:hypothetical protein